MSIRLERKAEKLIGVWVNKLGIADYTFNLTWGDNKTLRGDWAKINTDEELREASLYLNKDKLLEEPSELEPTVIHELLHVRLNEIVEMARKLISVSTKDTRARRVMKKTVDEFEHKVVVAITKAFAENK